jgi:hypothetical protein
MHSWAIRIAILPSFRHLRSDHQPRLGNPPSSLPSFWKHVDCRPTSSLANPVKMFTNVPHPPLEEDPPIICDTWKSRRTNFGTPQQEAQVQQPSSAESSHKSNRNPFGFGRQDNFRGIRRCGDPRSQGDVHPADRQGFV